MKRHIWHSFRDVYTTRGGRLPIKWMALEALRDGEFSMKTDVCVFFKVGKKYEHNCSWSFGVVLWEMYTMGRTPLANIEPRLVLEHLDEGNRLSMPEQCPDEV